MITFKKMTIYNKGLIDYFEQTSVANQLLFYDIQSLHIFYGMELALD